MMRASFVFKTNRIAQASSSTSETTIEHQNREFTRRKTIDIMYDKNLDEPLDDNTTELHFEPKLSYSPPKPNIESISMTFLEHQLGSAANSVVSNNCDSVSVVTSVGPSVTTQPTEIQPLQANSSSFHVDSADKKSDNSVPSPESYSGVSPRTFLQENSSSHDYQD